MVLSMEDIIGEYLEIRVSMNTSIRRYLEMGVLDPNVRTWQLQDPRQKQEKEPWIPSSMD
jgi:hypothetical protein